jgi:hypothetical protein
MERNGMIRAPVEPPEMIEQEREEDDLSLAEVIGRFADLAEAICDFKEQVEAPLDALEARLVARDGQSDAA